MKISIIINSYYEYYLSLAWLMLKFLSLGILHTERQPLWEKSHLAEVGSDTTKMKRPMSSLLNKIVTGSIRSWFENVGISESNEFHTFSLLGFVVLLCKIVKYCELIWHQGQTPAISRIQLMGLTSAGRGVSDTDLVGCVLSLDISQASGGSPPRFYSPRRGLVHRLAPEATLFRGMPTRPEAFLGRPGVSGLRPCVGPTLKKALCHTRLVGGTADKYR